MKRKIIFLVIFALFLTTGFAVIDGTKTEAALAVEKVSSTDATVTADRLNIRQGPAVDFPVIRVLTKGQALKVLSKVGGWYAVYDLDNGCIGAVDGRYIKIAGEAVPASSASPSKTTPSKTAPKPTDKNTIVPADVTQDELALLELVNKARKNAGVDPLAFDEELLKVARLKANDMVDNSYFSHQSPTYGSPFDMMRQYGITFKTAGENIAGNQTLEGAFKAWMNSDGHKKNILNSSFNFIGVGVASSNTYGKILVQQFIGR